jgi:hypothetical protein
MADESSFVTNHIPSSRHERSVEWLLEDIQERSAHYGLKPAEMKKMLELK